MAYPLGQTTERFTIVNITNGSQCKVTTGASHGFSNKTFVRLTDLNGAMPTPRGEDPLNNYKFRIILTGVDSFSLEDPITFKDIDSTLYPPYVSGGSCNLVQTDFIYNPS